MILKKNLAYFQNFYTVSDFGVIFFQQLITVRSPSESLDQTSLRMDDRAGGLTRWDTAVMASVGHHTMMQLTPMEPSIA